MGEQQVAAPKARDEATQRGASTRARPCPGELHSGPPPQSTRTQGHRQPRGRLRSESRFIPLDLTPVSPFFLLMLLLMACSWHERSLEAISCCGRKPRAAVIHPAAGGGRRGEQAAAAMDSGQIGEAQGGPQSPWQAPHPVLGRGQRHEATPSHGNGPAHTKHPRLILVPRKAALAVPTVASARKGNGWGEQGEGKASPGPRNPGWGGRAPGSPPRRHPRALGGGPRASSHSPK